MSLRERHDNVIKWKYCPRYCPFVRGIHWSPVNSPHKGQWHGALMFSLICALNKRLRKQSWGWWFEIPSRSLWRRCNVSVYQLDVLPFSDVLNMFPFPLTARISSASAGVKQMSDDILEARNLLLRSKCNTSASTRWGLLTHTWASCQIRKIAVCTCAGNAGNVFPATDFKGNC